MTNIKSFYRLEVNNTKSHASLSPPMASRPANASFRTSIHSWLLQQHGSNHFHCSWKSLPQLKGFSARITHTILLNRKSLEITKEAERKQCWNFEGIANVSFHLVAFAGDTSWLSNRPKQFSSDVSSGGCISK